MENYTVFPLHYYTYLSGTEMEISPKSRAKLCFTYF